MKNSNDPAWREIVIPLTNLCPSNDPLADNFTVECWDYNATSASELVGFVRTTLSSLIRSAKDKVGPNGTELILRDVDGESRVGALTVASVSVKGPTKQPPSLLRGDNLRRLAYRASLVATAVADMTLWERGLNHQEGLLSLASLFNCYTPVAPKPERPIWRIKAMEDQRHREEQGLTTTITFKESVESFHHDLVEEMSADMLSLNPPPPASRRKPKYAGVCMDPTSMPQSPHLVGQDMERGGPEPMIDPVPVQVLSREEVLIAIARGESVQNSVVGSATSSEGSGVVDNDEMAESEGSVWGDDGRLGASGVKWRNIGSTRPTEMTELKHPDLADALKGG